jgi:glycosyltransferase involved in cell wall biosynthesis
VLATLPFTFEVIYINDGSNDNTLTVMQRLCAQDSSVALVDLSRNFGKEIALTAGLDHAQGDAVIVIDADLQDPLELIPKLIECWETGYDVVYAKRMSREGESLLKRMTARMFYRFMQTIGCTPIPEDTGDFRLLSRRALEAVNALREHHRFMKGLFTWIGYKQIAVPYHREARFAGQSKWNYWRLWNFALEDITSFTTAPLLVSTYVGLITAWGALVYGLYIIITTLLFGNSVPGYPSLSV